MLLKNKIINYIAKYFRINKPTIKFTEQFSFCESLGAQANSPWHIRKIDERGKKLGGGIYSKSLCRYLDPENRNNFGGWDIGAKINEYNLSVACKKCAEKYRLYFSFCN